MSSVKLQQLQSQQLRSTTGRRELSRPLSVESSASLYDGAIDVLSELNGSTASRRVPGGGGLSGLQDLVKPPPQAGGASLNLPLAAATPMRSHTPTGIRPPASSSRLKPINTAIPPPSSFVASRSASPAFSSAGSSSAASSQLETPASSVASSFVGRIKAKVTDGTQPRKPKLGGPNVVAPPPRAPLPSSSRDQFMSAASSDEGGWDVVNDEADDAFWEMEAAPTKENVKISVRCVPSPPVRPIKGLAHADDCRSVTGSDL